MYSVMFLNFVDSAHSYSRLGSIYMALVMGCPMAIMMRLMMGKCIRIKSQTVKLSLAYGGFRMGAHRIKNQTPVGDEQ
jgi:hypothetical protein